MLITAIILTVVMFLLDCINDTVPFAYVVLRWVIGLTISIVLVGILVNNNVIDVDNDKTSVRHNYITAYDSTLAIDAFDSNMNTLHVRSLFSPAVQDDVSLSHQIK